MKALNKHLLILFMSTGILVSVAPLTAHADETTPVVAQDQKATTVVQVATYRDGQNRIITVVTMSDGNIYVTIDEGAPLTGEAAQQALAEAGIGINVSPNGHIMSQTASRGTKVLRSPVLFSNLTAKQRADILEKKTSQSSAETTRKPAPILMMLPETSAMGSSAQTMEYASKIQAETSVKGSPVSK